MDNNIVTQSNSLIEAHYSFSLLEMQIFLYGLSLVNPFEKKCTLEYEVKINDFINNFISLLYLLRNLFLMLFDRLKYSVK